MAARTARAWAPVQYLKYNKERLRPALDLLQQVTTEVSTVVDIGCGTGNITPFLLNRWPNAHIQCVDSSAEMLETAKIKLKEVDANFRNVSYTQTDFEGFYVNEKVDLIFSNAALHWVSFDVHKTLLPRYLSYLKPGGQLAFQIPDSRRQNSHVLMQKAADCLGLNDRLQQHVRWVTTDADPEDYYKLLSPHCKELNMWSTEYTMVLEGENPVADFTSSSGLGPYLEALGGKETKDGAMFVQKYRELILEAYPKQASQTTLFPFKRFFLIASV